LNTSLWNTDGVGERPSSPTFAGREVELGELCAALVALDTTGARTVLVGGDAGIGKTRLIDEFRGRAEAAGALIACGVCSPAEGGGLPYGSVVGVFRDLSRRLDEATASSVLLPARHGLGLDGPTATPASAETVAPNELVKTALFEAILSCFTTLAGRSRVVIVFEDLHWADSATVDLIEFLARNLAESPVLLIGTYRSDALDRNQPLQRMLAELARHRSVSRVELSGLGRDAIAALMSGILGRQPEWALLDAVHGRCEGNPFFAEELTAARDATALPSVLRNVIMLRVDRLKPEARHIVAVAAAAGGSIDYRLLATAGDLDSDTDEYRVAISEAVELQVLTVDDGSRFRFRHALLRDAVYDSILPSERSRLHRQLAVALIAHPELAPTGPGHTAIELAAHWWEANEWSEALHASIAAGDAMIDLLAMPEAYAHYERALSAWKLASNESIPDVDYLRLIEKAADTAYFVGRTERSRELTLAALNQIDSGREPEQAAVCQTRLARYCFSLGDTYGAFQAFQAAAALLREDPPSAELAGVLAEEARCLLLLSRFDEAEALCHRSLEASRATNARAEEGHALDTLGVCRGLMGHFDEGIALVRDALAIAEDLGLPENLNLAYCHVSFLLLVAGRLDAAAAVALDGAALGESLGGIRLNGAAVNSAEALIQLGRQDEAEALLCDLGELVGNCAVSPPLLRSVMALHRGDHDEAARLLMIVDQLTAGLSEVQFRAQFHSIVAQLALEEGRANEASEAIDSALSLAAGTVDPDLVRMCALGVRALADGIDDARARGRRADLDKAQLGASALVHEAERVVAVPLARGGTPLPAPVAYLAVGRAEQSRLTASDPELWAAAVVEWDALSSPYEAAYCRWREAEALLQTRSGRARATELVQQAWRASLDIGAVVLAARIERLAQRARISLTAAETAEPDTPAQRIAEDLELTPREVEVLAQLARGQTDRQIADELFISKKTASVHVSNILRKLNVTSRFEAAEIGQRAGLG
jgi:DNA-binding CsgD family transcriptional regulator